jgi:hypothetical protein
MRVTFKVKELIEELRKFDPEIEVYMWSTGYDGEIPITKIHKTDYDGSICLAQN